ncbi:MAG: [Clostridia bacterium]|nr:[FeFe] hydrogenase H-cluster maturation GTPase HydF [Clostridia bacterium]
MADLNLTPSANRVHIGFFGRRNAGKSSVVNAVTNQDLSVVSDVKGTTTDPVSKAMEILPIGPVVIIDTPGFDDEGVLGELRVKKTKQILGKTDVALLVVDASVGKTQVDEQLISIFIDKEIPYIVVYNKSDLKNDVEIGKNEILVSAITKQNINDLKEKIGKLAKREEQDKKICSDLIEKDDFVVLCCPIDESAPKGRMILPQVQAIRDILDGNGICIVTRETELVETLKNLLKKPKLVITDSQVFGFVKEVVPEDIMLTSFSILFARYKGFLETAVKGAMALKNLQNGDKVLISEGCTHHRQCNDIGVVKMPKWLKDFTGKDLQFDWSSGTGFPEDLSQYKLVVHCGACMLNEREMRSRIKYANTLDVPFTNYGVIIAYMNGILPRSLEIFTDIRKLLD